MRFMVMHKMTEEMETDLPPEQDVVDGVDQLISEGLKDKTFISGEGLQPSRTRLHIRYENGRRTIENGPFANPSELVGGFTLLKVRSREEAIACCDQLAAALGDVELYLGPVNEAWDMGFMPKPENAPLRFLALHKISARAEQELPPDSEAQARLAAVIDELKSARVLQGAGMLTSTKKGARIRFDGPTPRVIDGPFAESKELVAGYALVELPSRAAAIDWAVRYGKVVKVNEVDVRQLSA